MSFSTSFPQLDTLHRRPLSPSQDAISNGLRGTAALQQDTGPVDFAWNKAVLDRGSAGLTAAAVLEANSRLVSAFTGEDDVLFRYSLPPSAASSVEPALERSGVATAGLEYEAAERSVSCAVTRYPGSQYPHEDAQTDFSVDVLENGQTASFSTTKKSKRSPR
ncbi:putative amp-dependent synthetase ligase protein [Neofusicoccum parvum UCRNP2]|uniref:Putative amp-dependent synthetase ligase protein n=1 Tax=Botryosphaeria parva (strain UCR-NP2) TaxID=1287680 RepID=R1ERV6_BOTPV|nr:putative amp-dependent synthetase ligase protein [Neofusicoccum parvum UCRNP2]